MASLSTLWAGLQPLLQSEVTRSILRGALLLVVGLPAARVLSRTLAALLSKVVGAPRARVLQGFLWYGLLFVVVLSAMRELGFDLSVLMGAAGVLTVAIGFASQTSASNVISGLFLLAERPFEPGDVIEVEGTQGIVLSIDLLSVKIRTFDNLFVRLPNETLVKVRIVNHTRFPIRRIDVPVGVAYDSDLRRVEAVLREVVEQEPLLLDEPRPMLQVQAFGPSSIDLKFSAWTTREDLAEARLALFGGILRAFRAHGIEIPFPHQVAVHREPPPKA